MSTEGQHNSPEANIDSEVILSLADFARLLPIISYYEKASSGRQQRLLGLLLRQMKGICGDLLDPKYEFPEQALRLKDLQSLYNKIKLRVQALPNKNLSEAQRNTLEEILKYVDKLENPPKRNLKRYFATILAAIGLSTAAYDAYSAQSQTDGHEKPEKTFDVNSDDNDKEPMWLVPDDPMVPAYPQEEELGQSPDPATAALLRNDGRSGLEAGSSSVRPLDARRPHDPPQPDTERYDWDTPTTSQRSAGPTLPDARDRAWRASDAPMPLPSVTDSLSPLVDDIWFSGDWVGENREREGVVLVVKEVIELSHQSGLFSIEEIMRATEEYWDTVKGSYLGGGLTQDELLEGVEGFLADYSDDENRRIVYTGLEELLRSAHRESLAAAEWQNYEGRFGVGNIDPRTFDREFSRIFPSIFGDNWEYQYRHYVTGSIFSGGPVRIQDTESFTSDRFLGEVLMQSNGSERDSLGKFDSLSLIQSIDYEHMTASIGNLNFSGEIANSFSRRFLDENGNIIMSEAPPPGTVVIFYSPDAGRHALIFVNAQNSSIPVVMEYSDRMLPGQSGVFMHVGLAASVDRFVYGLEQGEYSGSRRQVFIFTPR